MSISRVCGRGRTRCGGWAESGESARGRPASSPCRDSDATTRHWLTTSRWSSCSRRFAAAGQSRAKRQISSSRTGSGKASRASSSCRDSPTASCPAPAWTGPAWPALRLAALPERPPYTPLMVDPRKIAVLGAGRIGESLISGPLSSGWREPSEVFATTRRAERVAELRERYGVEATLSNHDAAAGAALVVIAVKPQDIEGLLGEIGTLVLPEQTVLSIAAAIPTSRIENRLSDGVPVVRAMPNTPSTVHEGIACLCPRSHTDQAHPDPAQQ